MPAASSRRGRGRFTYKSVEAAGVVVSDIPDRVTDAIARADSVARAGETDADRHVYTMPTAVSAAPRRLYN